MRCERNGLLFVAGVLPVDAEECSWVPGTWLAQASHVLAELGEVLAAGGCSGADVAVVNVYLTAIDDRLLTEQPWQRAFGGVRPSGTIVEVRGLAVRGR